MATMARKDSESDRSRSEREGYTHGLQGKDQRLVRQDPDYSRGYDRGKAERERDKKQH